MRLRMEAAGEEVLSPSRRDAGKPISDRCSGLLGDLELDRPIRLLLDDSGPALGHRRKRRFVDCAAYEVLNRSEVALSDDVPSDCNLASFRHARFSTFSTKSAVS